MLDSRMLYKYPGKYYLERDYYDYIIIPIPETEAYLKDGWSRTPAEAFAKHTEAQQEKPEEKPTYNYIKPKDMSSEMKIAIAADERSYREICDIYNVSYSTVFKIKTGKI